MKPLLELRNVTKSYYTDSEPYHAVQGVSLQIEPGEFTAIMGPSGSGKSTLMHLLGLLDKPTTGEVVILSKSTQKLREDELADLRNQQIGFVFQSFHLLSRTSILENVLLPRMYARNGQRMDEALALEALQKVGLEKHHAHRYPNQLSGGQQQRVAIARAILANPSIILADEPTGNLDSRSTDEILTLFQQLNKDGATVVLVTHDPYVAQHARRVLHVRDGAIELDEHVQKSPRILDEQGATT